MPAPTTSALRTLIGELLPTNTATGSADVVQVSHRGPFRNAAAHPVSSLLVQASSSWKSFQDQ
jgi:hypothetical protein